MKVKTLLFVVLLSASTSFASLWFYGSVMHRSYPLADEPVKLPVNYARYIDGTPKTGPADFTVASSVSTPAVVHIKTRIREKQVTNRLPRKTNPFSDLFGGEDPFGGIFGAPRSIPDQQASGSGVLVSSDGYIVTNNHVIENADEINVTLANRKSYKATLVGTDPNMDWSRRCCWLRRSRPAWPPAASAGSSSWCPTPSGGRPLPRCCRT